MSDEETSGCSSAEERLLADQRKEKRDLQALVMQLKKSINKDKKKKREITEEITKLENEMKERHDKQLLDFRASETQVDEVSNNVEAVDLKEDQEEEEVEEEEEREDAVTSQPDKNEESGRKMSKAEKRRQKKAEANREREARIREGESNNKYSARNVEMEKLRHLLRERRLKMYDIKPDGDCMYAAIAHQLGGDATVSSLRSQAGRYIRSNYDDFSPFITDPKTGDALTTEQFSEYCDKIETTPVWGGQPELRALSQVMKRRIEVVQAVGTPVVCGDEGEDSTNGKTILLAYCRHFYGLGEHYNSVVALAPEKEEAR